MLFSKDKLSLEEDDIELLYINLLEINDECYSELVQYTIGIIEQLLP